MSYLSKSPNTLENVRKYEKDKILKIRCQPAWWLQHKSRHSALQSPGNWIKFEFWGFNLLIFAITWRFGSIFGCYLEIWVDIWVLPGDLGQYLGG